MFSIFEDRSISDGSVLPDYLQNQMEIFYTGYVLSLNIISYLECVKVKKEPRTVLIKDCPLNWSEKGFRYFFRGTGSWLRP